jgi:hypothetical protein
MSAYQWCLFAEVRAITGHYCSAGGAALANIANQAIHTTTAGAYDATLKQRCRRKYPFPQLTTTIEVQVSCQLSIPLIPQLASFSS